VCGCDNTLWISPEMLIVKELYPVFTIIEEKGTSTRTLIFMVK
jgi:hypothetical protein